jgi:hypothetical protein
MPSRSLTASTLCDCPAMHAVRSARGLETSTGRGARHDLREYLWGRRDEPMSGPSGSQSREYTSAWPRTGRSPLLLPGSCEPTLGSRAPTSPPKTASPGRAEPGLRRLGTALKAREAMRTELARVRFVIEVPASRF